MAAPKVLPKYALEGKLKEENDLIKNGILRDENPLDTSAEFDSFLLACRHGDLKICQELISQGVNINGKDRFDYTPLIIASLCGHYELVQLLLESGANAERDTFQGERCIYNALNERIRNLLLQYDFSKSTDPYIYWSSHVSNLLNRSSSNFSDISLHAGSRTFSLHKFFLSSRTPYFRSKLEAQPDTTTWNLSDNIPREALQIVIRYLYLGDLPRDLVPHGSRISEEDVLKGLDKISKDLEIGNLWETIMASSNRRLARQRYQDEVGRAVSQVSQFFNQSVLGHKMIVDSDRVNEVKWKHDNSIFADVLLRADMPLSETAAGDSTQTTPPANGPTIPIGPTSTSVTSADASSPPKPSRRSVLYPVHKALLIRSDYFEKMFSSDFMESRVQEKEHLHIVTIDCTPEVLELILTFLYTEKVTIPLEHALDVLYAADMLFLDPLKTKAAQAINTLGSGSRKVLTNRSQIRTGSHTPAQVGAPAAEGDAAAAAATSVEVEPVNIYDVIHAAWDLRVQRLEEFAARYLAYRLEDYVDEADFQDLIQESAARLKTREETDTIELLDDIRYYLGERFRLRFEDVNLEEAISGHADAQPQGENKDDMTQGENKDDTTQREDGPLTTRDRVDDADHVATDTAGNVTGADLADAEDDELLADQLNYELLLGKIDAMLDRLKLDA